MMMWDQGTRNNLAEVRADGINGDTQDGVPLAFLLAADKTGHP
jgi:iron(II)-dependent oxidoreductase